MNAHRITRRGALTLALGGFVAASGAKARAFKRLGVAFGTTVSIRLEAVSEAQAEAAFAAAFAEICFLDRLASLVRPESQVFQLNRDGRLDAPDPALIDMLSMAQAMHGATQGAFDVTIQPLWLAFDRAAKAGGWLNQRQAREFGRLVDQRRLSFDPSRVEFTAPGMQITLNSLARGLAADRVGAALARAGIERAFFDTDVLGERGGAARARIRHPRDAAASVAHIAFEGCLATSGDYQYFWSPDYARHHIVDPRLGASPAMWSSVSVLARSGLLADALSTAAFLSEREAAMRLLQDFGAEALFVDKAGAVSTTPGFPISS